LWRWSWFGIWRGGRCGSAGGAQLGGGGTGDGLDASSNGGWRRCRAETCQQLAGFVEAIGQLCTGSTKGAHRISGPG
jgi:hypothetical protein